MKRIRWSTFAAGKIVFLLALYLPFESSFLKFLPQNIQPIAYLLPEIVLWITFLTVMLRRVLSSGVWLRTFLDGPLFLFGTAIFLSVLINKAFSLGTLENVNALLKYMPAYFIAAHTLLYGNEKKIFSKLYNIIISVAVLEIVLGSLQMMNVPWISNFLQPIAIQIGAVERSSRLVTGAREIGAVYGTLGDTIHYGWFLSVALIMSLARIQVIAPRRRWRYWIIVGALLIFIGFSYSRVLIFSALFILFWRSLLHIKRHKDVLPILLIIASVVLIVTLLIGVVAQVLEFQSSLRTQQSFFQDSINVLTERYRQIAYQFGRLGWAIETPPTVLLNKPFLGFGPDREQAYTQLYSATPTLISSVRPISTMEDVYWVALLIYYGLLGLGAWVWMLVKHYRLGLFLRRVPLSPTQQQIVWISLLYIPLMGLAQFANQAFEFRIASFYFWLFLGLLQGVYWSIIRNSPHTMLVEIGK